MNWLERPFRALKVSIKISTGSQCLEANTAAVRSGLVCDKHNPSRSLPRCWFEGCHMRDVRRWLIWHRQQPASWSLEEHIQHQRWACSWLIFSTQTNPVYNSLKNRRKWLTRDGVRVDGTGGGLWNAAISLTDVAAITVVHCYRSNHSYLLN